MEIRQEDGNVVLYMEEYHTARTIYMSTGAATVDPEAPRLGRRRRTSLPAR